LRGSRVEANRAGITKKPRADWGAGARERSADLSTEEATEEAAERIGESDMAAKSFRSER